MMVMKAYHIKYHVSKTTHMERLTRHRKLINATNVKPMSIIKYKL